MKFDVGDTVIFRDGAGIMRVGFILRFAVVSCKTTSLIVTIEYEIKSLLEEYMVDVKDVYPHNKKDADLIKDYNNRWYHGV